MKYIKEKLIGATGSVSGIASILGSWQICHNVCLGLIALLSVVGITLTGMPLAFLTKISVPLWSGAVVLLIITYIFYKKMHCISRNLLIINKGLIIAGIPFAAVQQYKVLFWIVGGSIVLVGILNYIKERREKKHCEVHK